MKERFSDVIKFPARMGKIALNAATISQNTVSAADAMDRIDELFDSIKNDSFFNRAKTVGSAMAIFSIRAILNPPSVEPYHDAAAGVGRDPLTGLSNRIRFISQIDNELQQEGSHALMMFDMIDFSAINNQQGQLVGDEILQAFAGALASNFRYDSTSKAANDNLDEIYSMKVTASRLGGDEFAVLLKDGENLNTETLHPLALKKSLAVLSDRKLLAKMKQTGIKKIGVKVGAAMFGADIKTFDEAMTFADHKTHTDWAVTVEHDTEMDIFRHYLHINKADRAAVYEVSDWPMMKNNSDDVTVDALTLKVPALGSEPIFIR